MKEIIQNWGDYILHEKYLPQRGASFLLNNKNQVIYKLLDFFYLIKKKHLFEEGIFH